jgi:hypothetical protein
MNADGRELAGVQETPGETEIRRDNLQRNVQVTALRESKPRRRGEKRAGRHCGLHLPPGIRAEYVPIEKRGLCYRRIDQTHPQQQEILSRRRANERPPRFRY